MNRRYRETLEAGFAVINFNIR